MNIKLILSYYWPHMKKYPKSGIGLFFVYTIAIIASNLIFPYIIKETIDTMTSSEPSNIIAQELFTLIGFLAFITLIFNVFYRIGDYLTAYFQSNTLKLISDAAFEKLQKHSYTFFANNFTGSLVAKAGRFTNAFAQLHDKLVYMFYFSSVKLIGILLIIFYFAPLIGMLFIVWFIIYCFIVFLFIRKKFPLDLAEATENSRVTARFADTFTNALTVKMFASNYYENTQFKKATCHEEKKRRKAWYFGNFQRIFEGLLFAALQVSIMILAVKLWLSGDISTGTVVLIQLYVLSTFDIVWNIGRTLTESAKSLADAKEMIDIFEEKPDVQDIKEPEKCKIKKGKITFDAIHFSYNESEGIFDNFSLTINSGERVGLVGHSGAGKTTITKLLLRFTNVNSGVITIDDQDISKITQDDLRRNIAYVPQEPLLFHRSLRENITYGKPDATDEEIIDAAKKANAHNFIITLKDGYDTLVGERGIKLSGGERQRVTIARAMLKDAPILILDEATSSLDSTSEKMIQEAFEELMKDRTTLVIAHRLSTIQKMDRIIVLDAGKITEQGTHKELLAKNGNYATFWKQQTGGYLGE